MHTKDDVFDLNYSSDENEEMSAEFLQRLLKPNVFTSFVKRLNEKGDFNVQYNDYDNDNHENDNSCDECINETTVNIEEEIEKMYGNNIELDCEDERSDFDKTMFKKIVDLKARFERYCSSIPVLGFNSSKYDLNLIKSKLPEILKLHLKETKAHIIKKNNSYLQIETPNFRFLDISHYLAPGSSYSSFLKAYNIKEKRVLCVMNIYLLLKN